MNIVICDDDEIFCELLHCYLEDYFEKYEIMDIDISVYHSSEEMLICDKVYDMAFLDVEMKGLSGIYAGRELRKKNSKLIIFIITSYSQYLDEALRFNAFRYLTKPLDVNRLYMNLKDAIYIYINQEKKVLVETTQMDYTIATSSIIMIEASNRKVIVHTINGDYITTKPLSSWQAELEGFSFVQTHKSYVVNLAHVRRFDKKLVYLTDKHDAYLTQRKYTIFKKKYIMYLDASF